MTTLNELEALAKLAQAVALQNETITAFKEAMQSSLEFLSRKSGEVHGMVERMTYGKRGKYRAARPGRVWK